MNRPKPWVFWQGAMPMDRAATANIPSFHLPQSRDGTSRAVTLPDGYYYANGTTDILDTTISTHFSDRKSLNLLKNLTFYLLESVPLKWFSNHFKAISNNPKSFWNVLHSIVVVHEIVIYTKVQRTVKNDVEHFQKRCVMTLFDTNSYFSAKLDNYVFKFAKMLKRLLCFYNFAMKLCIISDVTKSTPNFSFRQNYFMIS